VAAPELNFEWATAKAASNRRKHGVTFEEATTVFADRRSRTILDPDHSFEEDRFITVGRSEMHRVLVVVHTERGDRVRLISARIATKIERKQHEEGHEKAN
jgi:uncharacterized DUF497 family protein